MLQYDPKVNLNHYPISMSRFGFNPYGEPKYRIVSTASRRHLVGGLWADGALEYRWAPTYRQIAEPWIMEAWDTCHMTRAQWDANVDPQSGWLINGPYPERGEYYHCHTFNGPVSDANLDKLISWLEEGRKRSWSEVRGAVQQDYDLDTKDRQGRIDAIVRNSLPAYLDKPFVSGTGVKRGSKTAPILLSADDVRLPNGRPAPLGNNKFVNMPRPKRQVA